MPLPLVGANETGGHCYDIVEGSKVARQKFAPVAGENKANRPLDVVQIDHMPAGIILADSFERQPIGRPWVTLAVDIATRMVTGSRRNAEKTISPEQLNLTIKARNDAQRDASHL